MAEYTLETSATDAVPPAERAEFWCELLSAYHRRLGFSDRQRTDVSARSHLQRTARYQLVEWQQDHKVWLRRTAQHIRDDDDDDYRLALPVGGQLRLHQADVAGWLGPGRAALFTMNQPFDLGNDDRLHGLVLTIPRAEVATRVGREPLPTTGPIEVDAGLGRILRDLAFGLAAERDALDRRSFDATCERLVELLCLLLVGDREPDDPGCLSAIEPQARRYVREHAQDPSLTGARVARELGWSLRQVQRALRRSGTTPRELIRDERLRLAKARLQDPSLRHHTISEIAHTCGFSSHSALTHAMRSEHGVTPSELR